MDRSWRFPEGFYWGAATSAHQVEGDNRLSDWGAAEQAGRLPFRSGEACRHFELCRQDFDLARRLGHNAHRLSLEWSRIEPAPGRFDEAAIEHYRRVIRALRARGLEPIVTLHHFTSPHWFAEQGGWRAPGSVAAFARYGEQVARALGHEVRWWLTVNEPTVLVKCGYVTGAWPPFRQGDWAGSFLAMRNLCRAHVAAYGILHRYRHDAMVGLAHSATWVMPWDPQRRMDRVAAWMRDLGLNRLVFHLLGVPRRRPFDFLGVNYYTRAAVRWVPRGRALLFGKEVPDDEPGVSRRWGDTGWEIWPEGMLLMLRRLAKLGVPLMITENGLATRDEAARLDFLIDHLRMLGRALQEGLPVVGYLYWSLLDNYEWTLGFEPRFGLAEVDFRTQERRLRPTALAYAEVCRTNRFDEAAARRAASAAESAAAPMLAG